MFGFPSKKKTFIKFLCRTIGREVTKEVHSNQGSQTRVGGGKNVGVRHKPRQMIDLHRTKKDCSGRRPSLKEM